MIGAELRGIEPGQLVAEVTSLRGAGYFFESMTCVDRLEAQGAFELLYTFNRFERSARLALRVMVPKDTVVPSLSDIYPIAAWNEREAWEFYGVEFTGHPNLTWLLLPEDTDFHPLLKSFTAPPPSIYDDSLDKQPEPEPETKHGH